MIKFSTAACLVLLFIQPDPCQAQAGCTDTQALNYNAAASINDGSCLYPTTYYTPALVSELPADLKEISGLHLAGGETWGHNDSNFDPVLYCFQALNGNIIKKVELKDADNKDWEDLCSDGDNLYVGDFGNNNNDRENLGIYRVPFSAIGNGSNQSVNNSEYTFLPFFYPDQADFSTQPEDSSTFDCEAMLQYQNQLHLFTKRRKDYTTTHYVFDLGSLQLSKLETFNVNGLITGASISPDGKTIALTGYDLRGLPTVFCWLIWDWKPGSNLFFSGNKRRIELGSALQVGQVESIAFETNRKGYLANERTEYNGFVFVPERCWSFDFSAFLPESVDLVDITTASQELKLYPNPCTDALWLDISGEGTRVFGTSLYDISGNRLATYKGLPPSINTNWLPKGMYQLVVNWSSGQRHKTWFQKI